MQESEALADVRNSLFKTFRSYLPEGDAEAKALLEKNTYVGSDDPGQWAPDAPVVVHSDGIMLPEPAEVWSIELWFEATSNLETDHFFEHINYSVVAVWPT